jgi:hypothetical protein
MFTEVSRWQATVGQVQAANRQIENLAVIRPQSDAVDLRRVRAVGADHDARRLSWWRAVHSRYVAAAESDRRQGRDQE